MAELRAITGGAMPPQVRQGFALLAAALATERFAAALLQALGSVAGCDRCYIFEQDGPETAPSLLAARVPEPVIGPMVEAYRRQYFRTDPVSRSFRDPAARDRALLLTVEPPDLPDTPYRRLCFERTGIVQRVSLIQRTGEGWLIVNAARRREHGRFAAAELADFMTLGLLLPPLIVRHRALHDASQPDIAALEQRIAARWPILSLRERQVAARTAAGMTAEGIARDLAIGAASVITYRRRAYRRANVAGAVALCLALLH